MIQFSQKQYIIAAEGVYSRTKYFISSLPDCEPILIKDSSNNTLKIGDFVF